MTTDPDDLYRALLNDRRLPQMRRLTYRCATPARCLLLDALDTPLGVLLHQRRYKLSMDQHPGAARAKSTTFDSRHFKPRTGFDGGRGKQMFSVPPFDQSVTSLEEAVTRYGIDLRCDHVIERLARDEFRADWDAGRAEVLLRPDGSRLV